MVSSMTVFGVHTGPSNTTVGELTALWARIEDGPFDWISIFDHFYAADGTTTTNFDAVAIHAALAMTTTRVRCGSLVYCAGYRHPGVLAKAIATIDHLSGGRCDLGIGAGWARWEYDAYGIDFPRTGKRLDIMEEALRCLKGLLHGTGTEGDRFSFAGDHFRFDDAANDPRPIQAALPLWVGGGGEQRTLRIAAELADGWNVPFVSPSQFAHKREVLHRWCAELGRDPADVRCSVNVGCAPTEESLARQFGQTTEFVRPGVLMGSTQEMVEGIGRYVEAGADQINLAMRAPFELGSLDAITEAIAASG